MRTTAVLVSSLLLLACATGCTQARCAGQSVCQAGAKAGQAVSSAWNQLRCEACQPEPPTVVTCPVYADACCGGDTGIGRGGHGAFRIPPGPGAD